MRRSLVCGLALLAALVPTPSRAAVPVVVIDGKGWGHGVGMAQEGAFWMAKAGATTDQILAQFYPGAGAGRGRGPIRIPVFDAGAVPTSARIAFPEGGEVRETGNAPPSPGFPVRVPVGGGARIVFDGSRYRVEVAGGGGTALGRVVLAGNTRAQVPTLPPPPTTTTSAAPPPTEPPPASTTSTTSTTSRPPATTAPPPPPDRDPGPQPGPGPAPAPPPGGAGPPPLSSTRTLVAVPANNGTIAVPDRQRRYRGFTEATAASGTLRLVNTVDIETYLKGMGEVLDPTWPPAALRSQAIAARTYGLRAMGAGGEVCDTERCQVYLGAQAEYPAMNKAVDDTRERVLVFGGALISAVYSANGGGHSASREEGFGVLDDSIPYLRAAPYPTNDTFPWSVTVALTDVASRLRYPGEVTGVRVGRAGPSGRAIEVVVDGSAGPRAIPGLAFDAALGLRSTLFTLRLETGDAPAPPPPADESTAQALPDEAAAAAATETAGATTTTERLPRASGDDSDTGKVPEELLVAAAWLVTAVLGAAVVVSPIGGPFPWPKRRGGDTDD